MAEIRQAMGRDAAIIHGFVTDLAEYERAAHEVELDVDDYRRLIEDSRHFEALIADVDSQPAGMALWYRRFSTWKGPYIHLEDLYVRPEYRGQGIARCLMQELGNTAIELGMKRMEWMVLDWNQTAISTYEKMGARILPEWQLCQMDEAAIKALTSTEEGINNG